MAAKRKVKKQRAKKAAPIAEDQIRAASIRERMIKALWPVAELMDEATAAGLLVGFSIHPNTPDGKNHVAGVTISRVL